MWNGKGREGDRESSRSPRLSHQSSRNTQSLTAAKRKEPMTLARTRRKGITEARSLEWASGEEEYLIY